MEETTLARIFSWRAIATLTGALVIGALGSGVWDYLFKPLFIWAGSSLLDVATLGKQSLVDGMYVEVAKGSYERAANVVNQLLIAGLCAFGIAPPIIGLSLMRILRRKKAEETLNTSDSEPAAFVRRVAKIASPLFFALLVVQAVTSGALIIQTARLSYIIRAANYIEQCQRIVAPFQSNDERLLLTSAFARIDSKTSYIAVLDRLQNVAQSNAIKLPDFDVF
jgi:hypothetical protein